MSLRFAWALLLLAGCRDFSAPSALFGQPTDAATPIDAAVPPKGCQALSPAPRLCDDFDDNAPLADRWLPFTGPGATLALDSSSAVSLPSSALAQVATGAGQCTYARLERRWPSEMANQLALDVELRPSSPWPFAAIVAALDLVDPAGQRCVLLYRLNQEGTETSIQVQSPSAGDRFIPLTLGLQLDQWVRVRLDVHAGASGPVVTAYTNGEKVLTEEPLPECGLGGEPFLGLGFHCAETGAIEVRLDDVRFDFH